MNKNTIILFDLDGTIIDSTDAILASFYHSFEELEFKFKGNNESIKDLIGYPLDIMYKKLGVREDKIWNFIKSYKNKYRQISKENTHLLENAIKAVKLASQIAKVSVVTTKTRKYTIPLLENLKIIEHFEIITGRENVDNPKPHPEPINITLKQMNYNKKLHTVWMIGDTKLDLIAANKANIQSIGVLCGYGKKNELSLYTKNIKSTAFEAVKFIKTQIN